VVTKPKPDFLNILKSLAEYEVDFIVVGGICAVLHGAPISTFDLDVVHSRSPENIARLMSALESLEAYYRGQGSRILKPKEHNLSSPGHQLLMTRSGPLDLLGIVGKGLGYEELIESTVELSLSKGLKVRILNLETLIRTKEETARDKDKAVLPVLRRTLEEIEKS
jgi:hypothetical protein